MANVRNDKKKKKRRVTEKPWEIVALFDGVISGFLYFENSPSDVSTYQDSFVIGNFYAINGQYLNRFFLKQQKIKCHIFSVNGV